MSSTDAANAGSAPPNGSNPPPSDLGGPGGSLVGARSVVVLLVAVVALVILTFYGIWAFWPAENALGGRKVHIFGLTRTVSRETLFFVIIALSGALGGSVHAIRSISWYIGNRSLKWSWAPFYVLRPLVGATLATVFYFVLRAGLFSPSTQTKATSPYGFAALAALVGLFAEQAVEKLKTVAEQVFQQPPPGLDQAPKPDQGDDQQGAETPSAAAVTGAVTAVSPNTATVVGTVTTGGSTASYHFEYGTDTNYGSVTPDQSLGANSPATSVSAVLTGLIPATDYHYRLVVIDDSGTTPGADATVRTTA
jgi:hypothetical protein